MKICSFRGLSVPFVYCCLSFTHCIGQSAVSRGGGALDSAINPPERTATLGQQDASALAELAANVRTTGTSAWLGMRGTGKITYGGTDAAEYEATLSILGNVGFRLDSRTADGTTSVRIYKRMGKIQDEKGSFTLLVPNTASTGIFQFALPKEHVSAATNVSILDHGLSEVSGGKLHRITVEIPAGNFEAKRKATVATDLYFDPTSHFVVKSANTIRMNGVGNVDFLRVITYDDYRAVNGTMIPFRFTQTLDGQKQWTLQLTDVQLNPALKADFFQF